METFFCFATGRKDYTHSSYCGLHIKGYTTTTISFDHFNTSTSTSGTGTGWVSYYGI